VTTRRLGEIRKKFNLAKDTKKAAVSEDLLDRYLKERNDPQSAFADELLQMFGYKGLYNLGYLLGIGDADLIDAP